MALADRAELAVRLTLDDKQFTGGVRRASSTLSKLDKATSNTQRALGRTGAALQRTAVIAAAAATGGILFAVRAAGDFEDAFAGIVKTVDAPITRLDELRTQIRQMALEMPVAATELARIGEVAGALGIKTDFIDEFIETVAKLSVTTNLTSDEAADALGRISTILGFTGADIQTFSSALVALGNKGASTEAEIIEITKRFSAQGQQAGLTTAEILAFSSSISSLGVEVEAGGTALSKTFSRILTETALASDEAKNFAKVAGVEFKDFSKIVKDDTGQAILLFLKGLGKLDKFGQQIALEDIGITGSRERNAILLFAQNAGFLTDQLNIANEAIKDTAAIDLEAAKKFDTFNSKVTLAQNALKDMGITIGNALLPKIQPLLERLSLFVQKNQPAIERFGGELASAFEQVASAAQRLPWAAIKDGLGSIAVLAKAAFTAFTSAPQWLQTLLIGGFAINKATGGLLTGISKDLTGALFEKITTGSFFGRGATPANPLFVADVSGGLGGGLKGTGKGPGGFPIGAFAAGATAAVAAQQAIVAATGTDTVNGQKLPFPIFDPFGTVAGAGGEPVPVRITGYPSSAVGFPGLTRADAQMLIASQARTAFEAKANAAQVRMAVDRARHAFLTSKPQVNVSTVVNVSTSVSAGSAQNAIKTYQTWSGGRAINRLGVS